MPTTQTKIKLNPNVRLWLKALRSGKYEQANGSLRDFPQEWSKEFQDYVKSDKPTYCALGVAMEVAQRHGVPIPERAWSGAYLPKTVVDWLGLKPSNRGVKLNGESVYELNDDAGLSLPEIANQIKLHPQIFGEPRLKAKASVKAGSKTGKKSKKR